LIVIFAKLAKPEDIRLYNTIAHIRRYLLPIKNGLGCSFYPSSSIYPSIVISHRYFVLHTVTHWPGHICSKIASARATAAFTMVFKTSALAISKASQKKAFLRAQTKPRTGWVSPFLAQTKHHQIFGKSGN